MLNKNKYNLNFRPTSYFIDTGEVQIVSDSSINEPTHEKSENYRVLTPGGFRWVNGDNLPPLNDKEIEIARIVLESEDIFCISARYENNTIFYRIEDEYESEINFTPQHSDNPLTMGEIIDLIDSAEIFDDAGFGKGLTNSIRNYNLEAVDGENPEKLVDFVSVTSEFYPQLNSYYKEEAMEWLKNIQSKL